VPFKHHDPDRSRNTGPDASHLKEMHFKSPEVSAPAFGWEIIRSHFSHWVLEVLAQAL